MINFILGLFSYDLAIDLGTSNTLVHVAGKGIAIRESTAIAQNRKTKELLSFGNAAAKMYGKTGNNIQVIRPLKGGVVADFDGATSLLNHYIKKVHNTQRLIPRIPRPLVVVGIPSGITEVERKAVTQVAMKAGARKVYLVPEVVAAAVGAKSKGKADFANCVIDIGGGTTDIALIVEGQEASSISIRTAGDDMDQRIIEYVKLKYSLLIGQPTAEQAKIALADARPGRELYHVVRGRDLETGLPYSVRMSNFEVNEALMPAFETIIAETTKLFEEAPPELVGEVLNSSIVLTGGGALIRNLDVVLSERLKVDVRVADDPLTSVARGCAKLLTDPVLLKKVAFKPIRG